MGAPLEDADLGTKKPRRWSSHREVETPRDGGEGASHLRVTFDRLLHFCEHCAKVRRKVKPRLAQLCTMTGRSWSLRETQLMTVASGYVSGTMEHAAPAWLPATWPGNVGAAGPGYASGGKSDHWLPVFHPAR